MRYTIKWTQTLEGYFEVDANTREEALLKLESGEYGDVEDVVNNEYTFVEESCDNHACVVRVVWDTDGISIDDLPELVFIPRDIVDEDIADYLSDSYGWCVSSFNVEYSIVEIYAGESAQLRGLWDYDSYSYDSYETAESAYPGEKIIKGYRITLMSNSPVWFDDEESAEIYLKNRLGKI